MTDGKVFQRIKIFLCGVCSACAAFLFFVLRRESVHDNTDTDGRIASDIDRIEDVGDGIGKAKERIDDANRRLEELITEIETTGKEK